MKLCTIEGCNKPLLARGMCNSHYLRVYRKGEITSYDTRSDILSVFLQACLDSSTDDCSIPPGSKKSGSYPMITLSDGSRQPIGWIVLEKTVGHRPSPELVMRHYYCGNSLCCNPRHLCWGTEQENMEDKKKHGTDRHACGEAGGTTKLSNDQVAEMRKLRMIYGTPYQKLADHFRVSKRQTMRICKNQSRLYGEARVIVSQ